MQWNKNLFRVPAVLVCAAVLSAPMAWAHAHPQAMNPTPNSTVKAPAEVTMSFTEALEPKFSSLTLTDSKGTRVNKAASQVSSSNTKQMTLALPALPPGAYVVHWVAVASDGHRTQGEYPFTVK